MVRKHIGMFLGALLALLPACWGTKTTGQEKKRGLFVLNVLDKELYDDSHIKGSLSVPYEDVASFVENLDKDAAEIVVYCSNYMCTASGIVVQSLKSLGFKKVWAYKGGMAEWYALGLPHEGPSKSSYLSKANPKPAYDEHPENSITATQLYEKMRDGGIAKW